MRAVARAVRSCVGRQPRWPCISVKALRMRWFTRPSARSACARRSAPERLGRPFTHGGFPMGAFSAHVWACFFASTRSGPCSASRVRGRSVSCGLNFVIALADGLRLVAPLFFSSSLSCAPPRGRRASAVARCRPYPPRARKAAIMGALGVSGWKQDMERSLEFLARP